MVEQDTLLHREALFVVSSSDLEDKALELITQEVTLDFLTHSLFKQVTAVRVRSLGAYMCFSSSISMHF